MAKKKKQITSKPKEKKPSLGDDVSKSNLPFMLFTAFSLVSEELLSRKFIYDYLSVVDSLNSVLHFSSKQKKQKITISINPENLLIRQFSTKNEKDKLEVIYVITPSERKFKLI